MTRRKDLVLIDAPDISPWRVGNTGIDFVHRFDSGKTGADVVVCALMHGNEISGAAAMAELLGFWRHSGKSLASGRLTLAFCNVAAFADFDRESPDDSRFCDEDMNRVWSASRLAANTIDAQRAAALLPWVSGATHLLDLHSMHEPSAPLVMVGPLARNRIFADDLRCGVRAVADTGHADGVRLRDFGSYGDAGGTAISLLLEAGQHWEPNAVRVTRDVLARFLLATGVTDASQLPADWLLPDAAEPKPAVEVTHRIVAKGADVSFTQHFTGGEVIAQAGTVIGQNASEPITTPYDHCVLVMPSLRQARAGVTVLRLGRVI